MHAQVASSLPILKLGAPARDAKQQDNDDVVLSVTKVTWETESGWCLCAAGLGEYPRGNSFLT